MNRPARLILPIAVVAVMAAVATGGREQPPPDAIESTAIAGEMVLAAQRFIDTLEPGQQAKYLSQDAERGTSPWPSSAPRSATPTIRKPWTS